MVHALPLRRSAPGATPVVALRARALFISAALFAVIFAATASSAVAAPRPGAADVAKPAEAAKAAPAKLSRQERARQQQVRRQAATLIRQIRAAKPGSARYRLVDQLIDLGDLAWPVVRPNIPAFLRLPEGEAVTVDVLLGFMDLSYGAVERYVAALRPPAARRVVKFILRLDADKRQAGVLKRLLRSKDADLLLMVLPALLPHAREPVLARLMEIVDDKRPALSNWAIDTLAANRHAPAMATLVRLLGIEQRTASAKNLDRRRKLIHAIAQIGGEPAVPPLMEALNVVDQRPAVYEGLRVVGDPAVLAALFMLRTATGPRIAVAMDLLQHMRYEAAPHLVAMLKEANRSTRDLAIDVLTRIATPEVRPQLLRMVREKAFADVRDGVRILVTLYNHEVRSLMFSLLEHKSPAIRAFIVDQFWRLRDPRSFRVLRVVAAQDADRDVRLAAVRAVAGVEDPLGQGLLQRMASEGDPVIRREVVELLSRAPDWRRAVPTLAAMLADPNDVIFRSSLAALQRMTFQRIRRRPAQWRAWLRGANARTAPAYAQVQPDEVAFSAGRWKFAAQQVGTEGPTVLVVSAPPYRDATHLAPQVYQLAKFAKVVVMRRAPGAYRGARASQRVWSTEVDAMAKAVGARRYVLYTDAPGSAFALRHAAARKAARAVMIEGGWLPSRAGFQALPGQISEAMGELGMADWRWATEQQWRVPQAQRLRIALRGVRRGLLGVKHHGLWMQQRDVLAVDALDATTLQRVRGIVEGVRWGAVKRPVLLLLGSKAPWAKAVAEAASELPEGVKVRVQTIPGAGAYPLLERAGPTVDAIRAFLQ